MELDKLWNWQRKKLACRIRQENGNPAGDGLREMFAELAGVDLNELLSEMKTTKKKKEMTNKVLIDHEGDKNFKEVLGRSRVLGATKLALESMEEVDMVKANSVTNKNVRKIYQLLPKSPPKRVVLEIQRERSKPLRLPDQNENKATTDKLEKKLLKQRAARMAAAIELSAKEEAAMKKTSSDTGSAELMATCLPEYKGDMFSTGGQYLEGMLYLSRMADSSVKSKRIKSSSTGDAQHSSKEGDLAASASSESDKKNEKDAKFSGESDDKNALNENSVNPDMNMKLNCAVSLCNWARNPANAGRLASEGAVRAIMQLCNENVHKITTYCTAAFRFMSEHTELANSMIDEGAISTISDLVSSAIDDFMATNLAIALVNLTRINGKEAAVVDSAIVLALMNLIMLKPELGATCVRGLYNLTCVDTHYLLIERVIRALVSLSLSGTSNVKHLCAAALCNLSDLKMMRPRMVEEGAINVLSALSRGAETRTRRVCAVILQNLSAAKSVRVEMASRNSVTAAYGLSSDQDPIILRCIGLTLSRLAMEPSNCQRIIHESGIAALCNIAVKYPTIPGITQPVASAFQLLSSQQSYRISIVNEGSITAIASLMRSSVDMFTLQHSLLALCNLLCEADNHLPIIQQGLIVTLITMCEQDNDLIKDFCTLAFLNLSCAEESRKHLVNSGAIVAIIQTCAHNSEVTKRRCAATLSNLTYYSVGMTRMVADGIIPSIVSLVLAKDILTVHYSCAALCRLCSTVENARLILESGAVTNLVQGAIDGDTVTKQFCGAVLSSLSFYESCRVTLCELGAIAALKGLAELNDDLTKQRCLVAFANLSCEVTVQKQMISDGIVNIISELANSYQEINYICCAKAICNLACCEESKLTVAKDGGVHALLMISMVQSVDNLTKLLCVLGLNNLLDENTMQFMLSEGLVGSVANLSKIEDSNIANLSAKIFNNLTKNEEARAKIVDRITALKALFRLCGSNANETQIIAIRTVCNLILDGHVRGVAMKSGALIALEKGIELASNNKATILQCLHATFSICNDASFMELVSKTDFPLTLVKHANRKDTSPEEYTYIVKTIAMLLWEEKSRLFLQKKEFVTAVFILIQHHAAADCTQWLAAILRFLVLGYPDVIQLFSLGVRRTMKKLNDITSPEDEQAPSVIRSLVETIRTLSCCVEEITELATPETLAILNKAVLVCGNDANVMYDVAVILYVFASNGTLSRASTALPETVAILDAIKNHAKCADLLAVITGIYLTDVKTRSVFTNETIAMIIVRISETKPSEGTASNLVLGIYALARVAACREFLMNAPVHIDRVLTRLSLMDSARIKANCARAVKNLNSDLNEAIEEGAVASLIAISLEGKLKNQSSDEFVHPVLTPQVEHGIKAPECASEVSARNIDALWYEVVTVTKGGAAGKGPEPPEATANSVDGSAAYPNMMDELDSGESEGKTKMSFAKMQVPRETRDAYLLTDADFLKNLQTDKDESTVIGEDSVSDTAAQEALAAQMAEMSLIAEQNEKAAAVANKPAPVARSGSRSGLFARSRSSTAGSMGDLIKEAAANANSSGKTDSPKRLTPLQHGDQQDSPAPHHGNKKKGSGKPKSPVRQSKEHHNEVNMSEQAARLGLYA